MFFVLETLEIMWANQETLFLQQKSFIILNFLGTIFASWEANCVSATMFFEVGKQGNIDRKHNVSTAMFSSLPRALVVMMHL